jgi:hypothetical protein
MKIENQIRAFAGSFIIISLILSQTHSKYWLFFTAFVGLNLLQSSVTNFCLLEKILKRIQNK